MQAKGPSPALNLSKGQLENVIQSYLKEKESLNELLEVTLNALSKLERDEFLKNKGPAPNKANGYRKVSKPGHQAVLQLRVPRDRMGAFKPVLLAQLDNQEESLREFVFALYGNGLSCSQISKILEQVYGTNYSKASISRISSSFYKQIHEWLERKLSSRYLVIMIDAIHIKVRRERVSSEAFYVVMGLREDLRREILSIVNFPTESASNWQQVLKSLKERGVEQVDLFVSDDLKGLDDVISKEFKESMRQKCVIHFQRNLIKKVKVSHRKAFSLGLKEIFNPDLYDYKLSPSEAVKNLRSFIEEWSKLYPEINKIGKMEDLESLFTYLDYHPRVRRMIYSTNWIERFNKSIRRTTKIRDSLPSPGAALLLAGYVGMQMEEGCYKYPLPVPVDFFVLS